MLGLANTDFRKHSRMLQTTLGPNVQNTKPFELELKII